MSEVIFVDTERETALNTHRLHSVVSHNIILSANEQLDFTTLIFFFFCSFTDKILNSYIAKNMKCKLCNENEDLRESHIIPKFIFRWMRETSGGSFLRNAGNMNVRYQDGLKQRLFCQECEERLNVGETYFSKSIFYPYLNDGASEFSYDDRLFYFLISMLWRVLLLNNELLVNSNITYKEIFLRAENEWKLFLLGKTDQLEYSNIHLVFNDLTFGKNLPVENYNRYMTRNTDGALIHSSKSAAVYSKFSKFMIFGKLVEKPNVNWHGTSVVNSNGVIKCGQIINDTSIYELILERATEVQKIAKEGISQNQKEKIRKWGFDNIDEFGKSELFQVLDADYSADPFPENSNQ